jgi:hypothetical protein
MNIESDFGRLISQIEYRCGAVKMKSDKTTTIQNYDFTDVLADGPRAINPASVAFVDSVKRR